MLQAGNGRRLQIEALGNHSMTWWNAPGSGYLAESIIERMEHLPKDPRIDNPP